MTQPPSRALKLPSQTLSRMPLRRIIQECCLAKSRAARRGRSSVPSRSAFDNGYNVSIILSENSKALIEQTRKRLEDEFCDFIADGEVNVYDIMNAPNKFTAFELESKLIFVVKKQDDNLRQLAKLFTKGCPALAKCRTLIIDDEADAASVGYTRKEGLVDVRKIAKQISDLRNAIENVSFLQVTATPYSLYLQPERVAVSNSISFADATGVHKTSACARSVCWW